MVLRIGPWTIWNEIQKDARFPGVEEAIPGADAVSTRLQLDPEDARFLQEALDRLPGNEELNSPATLDMNGKVAIRAELRISPQITELVLDRSSYSGPAIRINTNRNFLKRAIQLGFTRDRHLGCGDTVGLSARAPGLRLATSERRCGNRAG